MSLTNTHRAHIDDIVGSLEEENQIGTTLKEALNYLKKFSGKTFVVKFSGDLVHGNYKEEVIESILEDIISLKEDAGINIVVVHGARKLTSDLMKKYDKEPKFKDGLRVTDEEALELLTIAFQHINHKVVWRMNRIGKGNKAVGISGVSGTLFEAEQKDERLGFVGEVKNVNEKIVEMFLKDEYIPVVYPIGTSEKGEQLNLNSDNGAGKLASGLDAEKYITLTNVRGILRDTGTPDSLISRVTYDECKNLIKDGTIEGHMVPKVEACLGALKGGAGSAHIVKAGKHSLLKEVLTREGTGTMIESS